jgi:hypothetical protein
MARTKIAWLALALPLAACLNQADTQKMDAATQQVFAELRAKDYEAMYAAAAPDLRAATSEATFVSFLRQVDGYYGDCQAPVKSFNFHVNATTNGYFSTQGYTAVCAKARMQLQVTMVLRQGVAKLVGLNVSPESPAAGNGT